MPSRAEDAGVHILTVFRSRLRESAVADYAEMADVIETLARKQPGLLDLKSFTAADGERVTLVTFDSWLSHRAWRDDAEHRNAQRLGRSEFYAFYDVTVSEVVARNHFVRPSH